MGLFAPVEAKAMALGVALGYDTLNRDMMMMARQSNTRGTQDGDTTHFGYQTLPLAQKQAQVDAVFHKVAGRYDLMNDLMSAGLHRLWKDAMVAELPLPRQGKRQGQGRGQGRRFAHLDVAGGTGDIAFRVLESGGDAVSATVFDINGDMLAVGRERAAKRLAPGADVAFIQGNAEELPFEDSSFDGYTIAFGIRNVPRIEKALAEARRVLRPGGRFLCLEFSHVDVPLLDTVYERYSFAVIPQLGKLVTGEAEPYQYLVESIRRFPRPPVFARMIAEAGFARVQARPMSGGIVALHSGWRL
jgi:demethylmenaquinone methyltransferase / 2-methoxy-6-polyprenyl-1,4-benzoquinol methylase